MKIEYLSINTSSINKPIVEFMDKDAIPLRKITSYDDNDWRIFNDALNIIEKSPLRNEIMMSAFYAMSNDPTLDPIACLRLGYDEWEK